MVKWALFIPVPLGQPRERVETCIIAKRLSIFSMMPDGKCPPHSRASHSLMNPCIPTKSHFGRPARWAPSLSFFLWASDLRGPHGSLGLLAWQVEGPGSVEGAPQPKLLSHLEVPILEDLFLFICCNLSSDQADSPLIIPVMPLQNTVQWICFSKNHSARD